MTKIVLGLRHSRPFPEVDTRVATLSAGPRSVDGKPLSPIRWMMVIAVCLGIVAVGWQSCGLLHDRVAVTGTVQFRGQPLAKGIIRFLPLESGLETGGAVIVEGRYLIPMSNGLVPGLYAIKITAPRLSSAGNDGRAESAKMTELIPFDYNQRTTLLRSVQRGRSNVMDFDLSPGFSAN